MIPKRFKKDYVLFVCKECKNTVKRHGKWITISNDRYIDAITNAGKLLVVYCDKHEVKT